MNEDFFQMSPGEVWAYAEKALRDGRLRDAKAALDHIGLRFDDAYTRLESAISGGQKEVWS